MLRHVAIALVAVLWNIDSAIHIYFPVIHSFVDRDVCANINIVCAVIVVVLTLLYCTA